MGARRGQTDTVLDRASPVPLYFQLAQNMETAIRSGRLSSGSHLDNELELARQLGVSRPTVRRAIGLLANKGLVIRRHGIGTLVVPVRVRRPVRLSSLYDDLKESGQTPDTRLLAIETVPAPAEVATALQLSTGTRVVHLARVRLVAGRASAGVAFRACGAGDARADRPNGQRPPARVGRSRDRRRPEDHRALPAPSP